ncbi:MAG TPA: ribosome silencing factor [Cyclobacteriaceae bacterium]
MQKTSVVNLPSSEISNQIVQGMLEKKGSDIVVMDLRKIQNSIADFFVLCSANSDTQVDAIATSIEESVYKSTEQEPWRTEGKQNKEWVLIDYVDVVAHIFLKDKRMHYSLEELWGDALITFADAT